MPGDRLLLREPSVRTIWAAAVADMDPSVARRFGPTAKRVDPESPGAVEDVDLSAIAEVLDRLAVDPFLAPDQDELRTLDRRALAHASRTGQLLDIGGGIYLAPHAPATAIERLGQLDQPFTVSDARLVLGSTRRVVVPLLEHLDAARLTRRFADGTRILVAREG
jgi:selenocysteine-specific elongation factor